MPKVGPQLRLSYHSIAGEDQTLMKFLGDAQVTAMRKPTKFLGDAQVPSFISFAGAQGPSPDGGLGAPTLLQIHAPIHGSKFMPVEKGGWRNRPKIQSPISSAPGREARLCQSLLGGNL